MPADLKVGMDKIISPIFVKEKAMERSMPADFINLSNDTHHIPFNLSFPPTPRLKGVVFHVIVKFGMEGYES